MALDDLCKSSIGQAPQTIVPWFLMASYLYYCRDVSLLSDALYDRLAKAMLGSWGLIKHQHKFMLTEQDLEAGSLYHLSAADYPSMVKSSACRLAGVPYKHGVH